MERREETERRRKKDRNEGGRKFETKLM